MTKVLIVNNNLQLGGVQKSLVNLLNELVENDSLEISLLLFSTEGPLIKRVPKSVGIITPSLLFRCCGCVRGDQSPLPYKFLRSVCVALTRVIGRTRTLRLFYPFQKKLGGYDVAVSFLHSGSQRVFYGGCNEFVLNCVDAEKKITFLHCDYESIDANSEENTKLYSAFDQIAACSEGARAAFLRVLPEFFDKTVVVPNCYDYDHLFDVKRTKRSNKNDYLSLITVARFGKEKGILRAIRAVASLGDKASMIRYSIIGSGKEYRTAEQLLCALNLNDIVTLYGEEEDPYSQMNDADVLIIPSVSEAAPLVVGEAAALGVPILTTRTSSAGELVEKTGFGWVCENTETGLQQSIKWLIENPSIIQERRAYLETLSFDNSYAVEMFMKLLFDSRDQF